MASFRKRGNKWQYRISYIDPITNKRIEVSKGGFDTKHEAKNAAIEHESKLMSGDAVVSKNELLKDYLQIWLKEYKKDNVRKNTYILHQRNVDNHIIPYFKNIKLKDITYIRHQKFLNYLGDQGYSARTITLVHRTMSNAMKIAVSPLGKIAKNPCDDAIVPQKTKEEEKRRPGIYRIRPNCNLFKSS